MKIRTSELTELQLDYLIANIEGRTIRLDPMGFGKQSAGDSSVSPAFFRLSTDNFPFRIQEYRSAIRQMRSLPRVIGHCFFEFLISYHGMLD